MRSDKRTPSDPADDLPAAGEMRWTAQRKASVAMAVRSGRLDWHEACARYMLSDTELGDWVAALAQTGVGGLLAKKRRTKRDH